MNAERIQYLMECTAEEARVMAAAPKLLETLKTICDYFSESHAEEKAADHYGDKGCSYCEAINSARIAIAKAEGCA